ncbi:MAG TPA: hypothetical protein VFZ66_26475 [Herpetosiphonaceae bacterium]
MLQIIAPSQIDTAVAALAAWLDTMRGPGGYGGPVAHWWQQSLLYTGAALDWRYEGIIAGYLQLWQRTHDPRWLRAARRAGDDLVSGQLPSGHFAASAFEINPATAGTPHEAACDVGLLLLALALRQAGSDDWQRYAACAERNLRAFYVEQLWDATAQAFRDSPQVPSFVPNKAATACEAFFLLAEITGDAAWVERYALPTLDRILRHQVRDGSRLDGAIAQNSLGGRVIDKYFPIYIARCVPGLLRGYRWTDDERYADAALRAIRFVARWTEADGTCPTVIYANQRVNGNPCWIAPLGDVLRAADEARPYGFDADLSAMQHRLLAGQDATGGIQTATGFAAQAGGRLPKQPDVRDLLHVVGWCDKAFRYLAAHAGPALPGATSGTFEMPCVFQGRALRLVETPEHLEIGDRRGVCYRWRKGEPWPEIAAPAFCLR